MARIFSLDSNWQAISDGEAQADKERAVEHNFGRAASPMFARVEIGQNEHLSATCKNYIDPQLAV